MFWLDLFAIFYEWQWSGEKVGNYIRVIQNNPIEDYELLANIFNIIKLEKMKIFFNSLPKRK